MRVKISKSAIASMTDGANSESSGANVPIECDMRRMVSRMRFEMPAARLKEAAGIAMGTFVGTQPRSGINYPNDSL
jgi:hypothetical protein